MVYPYLLLNVLILTLKFKDRIKIIDPKSTWSINRKK